MNKNLSDSFTLFGVKIDDKIIGFNMSRYTFVPLGSSIVLSFAKPKRFSLHVNDAAYRKLPQVYMVHLW